MYDADVSDLLRSCTKDDLDPLVGYLINRISSSLEGAEAYAKHHPDHTQYVDEIVEELQRFGGNTLVNLFRGRGVYYSEVLDDVCRKVGVDYQKSDTTEEREVKLLVHILNKSLSRLTPDQLAEIQTAFAAAGMKNVDLRAGIPAAVLLAQGGAYAVGGFLIYQVAVIVANAVAQMVIGHGLSLAVNAGLTRLIGVFIGPIGWVITGVWTTVDLAGPAYRVTIPCCCHIAYLRQAKKYQSLSPAE